MVLYKMTNCVKWNDFSYPSVIYELNQLTGYRNHCHKDFSVQKEEVIQKVRIKIVNLIETRLEFGT